MARIATGSPRYNATKKVWEARISMRAGRIPVAMPGIQKCVRAPACRLAASEVCENCARAIAMAKVLAKRAAEIGAVPAGTGRTNREWFEDWIEDRVRRGLTSTRDDRSHFTHHVDALLGDLGVADTTRADLERLVEQLDRTVQRGELSWKSAVNVWATVSKMYDDAANAKSRALRVRSDNPAKDVRGPDRGNDRAKQFLYPSEVTRLLAHPDVPIHWKRAVAIAVYCFPRDGEQRALDADSFDVDHGVIHIHKAWNRRTRKLEPTKTKVTRRFSVELAIRPLLSALHAWIKDEPDELLCRMPSECDMGRGLRRWLKVAGVTRAELHTDTRTTKAMTWHDLRATGITWMAIRGEDPLKIMQRAGHERYETTQKYVREAESLRDGFGDVFPPLPELCDPPADPASNRAGIGLLVGSEQDHLGKPGGYGVPDGIRISGDDVAKRRVSEGPSIADPTHESRTKEASDAPPPIAQGAGSKATQLDEKKRREPEPTTDADDLLALIREHDEPKPPATVISLDARRRGAR